MGEEVNAPIDSERQCKKCGLFVAWPGGFARGSKVYPILKHCRECANKRQRERKAGSPRLRALASDATMAWARRPENWSRYVCSQIRRRCKVKGIEFDITPEDISLPDVCPVLGIKIKRHVRGDGLPFSGASASVDRIDPSRGYVRGNVWVISNRANIIKHNATLEELELIVKALRAKI